MPNVSSFRFTGFLPISEHPDIEALFVNLTGNEAEQVRTDKSKSTQTLAGPFYEDWMKLERTADRLHIKVNPASQEFIPEIGRVPFPIIKCHEGIPGYRQKIYEAALANFNGFSRIGFGINYMWPEPDALSALERLAELLPTIDLSKEFVDLIFRINRPKIIEFKDKTLKINRLCSWSAIILKAHIDGKELAEDFGYAAQLDTDFSTLGNTSIERFELPEKLALCCELINALDEATKGDSV